MAEDCVIQNNIQDIWAGVKSIHAVYTRVSVGQNCRENVVGCGACSRETTTVLQLLPAAYHQSYQDNTGIYLQITHKHHSLSTWWCSRLRHCAKRWRATDSIPDGVTGIFHWRNHSGRTMALRSTQPLTGMNTRNTSWGVKAAGWQPYHFHAPIVM
jgi:hypothetical protein